MKIFNLLLGLLAMICMCIIVLYDSIFAAIGLLIVALVKIALLIVENRKR